MRSGRAAGSFRSRRNRLKGPFGASSLGLQPGRPAPVGREAEAEPEAAHGRLHEGGAAGVDVQQELRAVAEPGLRRTEDRHPGAVGIHRGQMDALQVLGSHGEDPGGPALSREDPDQQRAPEREREQAMAAAGVRPPAHDLHGAGGQERRQGEQGQVHRQDLRRAHRPGGEEAARRGPAEPSYDGEPHHVERQPSRARAQDHAAGMPHQDEEQRQGDPAGRQAERSGERLSRPSGPSPRPTSAAGRITRSPEPHGRAGTPPTACPPTRPSRRWDGRSRSRAASPRGPGRSTEPPRISARIKAHGAGREPNSHAAPQVLGAAAAGTPGISGAASVRSPSARATGGEHTAARRSRVRRHGQEGRSPLSVARLSSTVILSRIAGRVDEDLLQGEPASFSWGFPPPAAPCVARASYDTEALLENAPLLVQHQLAPAAGWPRGRRSARPPRGRGW